MPEALPHGKCASANAQASEEGCYAESHGKQTLGQCIQAQYKTVQEETKVCELLPCNGLASWVTREGMYWHCTHYVTHGCVSMLHRDQLSNDCSSKTHTHRKNSAAHHPTRIRKLLRSSPGRSAQRVREEKQNANTPQARCSLLTSEETKPVHTLTAPCAPATRKGSSP